MFDNSFQTMVACHPIEKAFANVGYAMARLGPSAKGAAYHIDPVKSKKAVAEIRSRLDVLEEACDAEIAFRAEQRKLQRVQERKVARVAAKARQKALAAAPVIEFRLPVEEPETREVDAVDDLTFLAQTLKNDLVDARRRPWWSFRKAA